MTCKNKTIHLDIALCGQPVKTHFSSGKLEQLVCHVAEAGGRHFVPSKRWSVSRAGVKASRYKHDLRVKILYNGHDDCSEGGQVLGIPHGWTQATRPGNVDVKADSVFCATLRWTASSRKKVAVVMTVDGNVQHTWVIVENLLSAIAVMDVLKT
jgi:hypothetical protein